MNEELVLEHIDGLHETSLVENCPLCEEIRRLVAEEGG